MAAICESRASLSRQPLPKERKYGNNGEVRQRTHRLADAAVSYLILHLNGNCYQWSTVT